MNPKFKPSNFVTGYNVWSFPVQAYVVFVKLSVQFFDEVSVPVLKVNIVVCSPTSELYESVRRKRVSKS